MGWAAARCRGVECRLPLSFAAHCGSPGLRGRSPPSRGRGPSSPWRSSSRPSPRRAAIDAAGGGVERREVEGKEGGGSPPSPPPRRLAQRSGREAEGGRVAGGAASLHSASSAVSENGKRRAGARGDGHRESDAVDDHRRAIASRASVGKRGVWGGGWASGGPSAAPRSGADPARGVRSSRDAWGTVLPISGSSTVGCVSLPDAALRPPTAVGHRGVNVRAKVEDVPYGKEEAERGLVSPVAEPRRGWEEEEKGRTAIDALWCCCCGILSVRLPCGDVVYK